MDKVIQQNTKIFAVIRGLLYSYIVTAFLLMLLSFLMLKLELPGGVISGGIVLAYIASNFTGGFFVGKRLEQRKFLWGLITSVFYFVILILVSLLLNRTSPLPLGNLATAFVICGFSGMLGGMLS